MRKILLSTVSLAAILGAAWAGWPTDSEVNVPLCTVSNSQVRVVAAPDGAGGFITAWQDSRGASADIYAQRVDGDGVPQWAADGVVVCDESSQQWEPAIVSDGAGGAILSWEDTRNGAADVYAQRIDPSGARMWSADGVAVITMSGRQEDVRAVSDGSGGAIVAWVDDEAATGPDIFAQRIGSDGNRLWPVGGVSCCSADDDQYDAEIVSDGQGGAIVVWEDGRMAGVYLQRVAANGTAQWGTDGIPVGTPGGYRSEHAVASDGLGGVIVSFTDDRYGNRDVFAQRFDGDGNPLWPEGGTALVTNGFQQDDSSVCPDGNGGAIVAWEDYRGADRDIYAQHLDFRGETTWTSDGVLVCGEPENQATVGLVSDGAGGAVVAWRDWRDSQQKIGEDLYSQRLDTLGARMWDAAGFPVSTAPDAQQGHVMLPVGEGAAFVVWEDRRASRTSDRQQDVFAQRVDGESGALPMCSIGSDVLVEGTGFGERKPKAYVHFESKRGRQRAAPLRVRAWTDTTIDATWTKKVPPDTYALWVKPRGGEPAQSGEITVVVPQPDAAQALSGAPKEVLTLTGRHFGTRRGRVVVEYLNAKGKTRRKRCRTGRKSWVMDPATGASSVDFVVPRLDAGTYDLVLVGKLGSAETELTIQ